MEEIQVKDAVKEARMHELNIHIMRFTDDEVLNDMENVLRVIHEYAKRKSEGLQSER